VDKLLKAKGINASGVQGIVIELAAYRTSEN
jgi:hypothetical protein